MGDSSSEMLVPRANEENFVFAFNNFDFSDRILRLEIMPDDESIGSSKKLVGENYHDWFSFVDADCSKGSEACDGAKIVNLHINSAILAAKSPFFYRFIKDSMRDSLHRNDVFLKIKACEEASLMDLLKFVYENNLTATSAPDLIGLLIAAHKFEVASCMRHSIQMLLKLPMTLEYALFYLGLHSRVLASEIVKPLIDAAKRYIAAHFRDFSKSKEEAMELPLPNLEVVLGSEGLHVDSEDDVFDFILKWARAHYPDLGERREILTKRLVKLICFPNMSSPKLKEVLVCPEFDQEKASRLVVEALFSKVEVNCGQHIHVSKEFSSTIRGFLGCVSGAHHRQHIHVSEPKDLASNNYGFLGRVYRPHCVIFFDLRRDELNSLRKMKRLNSQLFSLGGKRLYLLAVRHEHFGLYVHSVLGSETFTIDCEFAVMKKSSKKFGSKFKAKHTLDENGFGSHDLLGIPWTELMSDSSDYFIDGIFHLRAEIALVNNSQT